MTLCEWLTAPENEVNEKLLGTLFTAHRNAALSNDNLSSTAIRQTASVGKGIETSIASALLTLGDTHGPTTQARLMIFSLENEQIKEAIESGQIIPGWGNAFFKDRVDPAFEDMAKLVEAEHPLVHKRLTEISDLVFEVKGKRLYPNAAAYTAATAEILGLPIGLELLLAIGARLPAWAIQHIEARP